MYGTELPQSIVTHPVDPWQKKGEIPEELRNSLLRDGWASLEFTSIHFQIYNCDRIANSLFRSQYHKITQQKHLQKTIIKNLCF